MDKFDEKVIGYESTKDILRQILDILKRPEVYKRKGISIPRGLLMESDPGLGKSLLASILMEESERKPFVFRKTSQENSFLDELRTVFAMAKEDAPSILLLEDLNLYVESTSPYAPEWACLQACIDDAKDTDLFVIATTNDTRYMPPSLLRPGRFDYVIYLQPPIGENAENIVSYYLRDKDLAEDVLISDIVKAMPKVSCATLETVMNLAALNSVYQGHEHIQKEDITEALLQVVYKLQKTDQFSTNLTLIFIIGIPGKTGELHALGIVKCAAKGLAVGADNLLGFSGFLCFKANTLFAADLLSVQLCCYKPFTGALVQIGNFFFGLLKGQLDLLLCQGHQIFVDALQDEVHICPCHGNAAGQSLFVGFGVDVVLFQKHQPDALAVKVFVQSKTLFCISGHSGHRIEHHHIPRF